MKRFIAIALGCLVWGEMTQIGEAQLVRVGPFGGVNIRVPFVSVDVLPFGGGTRVRAPFTSVNTGLYGYGYGYGYGPRYFVPRYNDDGYFGVYRPALPVYDDVVPVYPSPLVVEPVYPERRYAAPIFPGSVDRTPVGPPSVTSVDQLRAAAIRLRRSLASRRDDGEIWLDYLRPDEIIQVIDRGERIGVLEGLLQNYEGVAANLELASIRSADGFWQTHRALRALVTHSFNQASHGSLNNQADTAPSPRPEIRSDLPTPAEPIKPAAAEKDVELPTPKPTTSI